MADTKISALPLATSIDGTEVAPIVQVSTNKRATLATVRAYVVSDATLLKTSAIGVTVQPYDATTLKSSAIGTTVQPYSVNTVLDASYVHTDNNYSTAEKSKLSGIAAGAEVNVNADWLAASGDAAILNKPTLAAVATTGAYADLSGKPTLGTAALLNVPATGNAATNEVVKGDDSRLTNARTPTAHTHTASEISDSTATGRAVMTAIDATAARAAIGAGTSSFSGAYADLSGKPALGTAAAAATSDFATATQGSKADTALQPAAIGVTVQGYDADLTSWASIAPSAKQDTLVSGANIKTVNGSSLLGSGDLTISGGGGTPGGATTQVQFNDAGVFAGAAGLTIDPATGAVKTATETVYELVGTVISAANGALQFKTLSGATTLTESLASGQAVTLEIYAGAFSVTWPTVYWFNTTSSTTPPILNTAGPTIIELWKRGTTFYGSKAG